MVSNTHHNSLIQYKPGGSAAQLSRAASASEAGTASAREDDPAKQAKRPDGLIIGQLKNNLLNTTDINTAIMKE